MRLLPGCSNLINAQHKTRIGHEKAWSHRTRATSTIFLLPKIKTVITSISNAPSAQAGKNSLTDEQSVTQHQRSPIHFQASQSKRKFLDISKTKKEKVSPREFSQTKKLIHPQENNLANTSWLFQRGDIAALLHILRCGVNQYRRLGGDADAKTVCCRNGCVLTGSPWRFHLCLRKLPYPKMNPITDSSFLD